MLLGKFVALRRLSVIPGRIFTLPQRLFGNKMAQESGNRTDVWYAFLFTSILSISCTTFLLSFCYSLSTLASENCSSGGQCSSVACLLKSNTSLHRSILACYATVTVVPLSIFILSFFYCCWAIHHSFFSCLSVAYCVPLGSPINTYYFVIIASSRSTKSFESLESRTIIALMISTI